MTERMIKSVKIDEKFYAKPHHRRVTGLARLIVGRMASHMVSHHMGSRYFARALAVFMLCVTFSMQNSTDARAEKIPNGVAIFAALDKVTARISRLEVALGESVEFGALRVTPHACFTRPLTEAPLTSTFVDVEERKLDGSEKRLFAGWMFAQSPGLNAVEHPVYDVWLTGCAKPAFVAVDQGGGVAKPRRSRRRRLRRR